MLMEGKFQFGDSGIEFRLGRSDGLGAQLPNSIFQAAGGHNSRRMLWPRSSRHTRFPVGRGCGAGILLRDGKI